MVKDNKRAGVAKHPGPQWSDEEIEAGDQDRQAWEAFFSAAKPETAGEAPKDLKGDEAMKAAEVRARYEAELLRYPNVVAVGEGIQTKKGIPTGRPCIVVFVERKLPPDKLKEEEKLPEELEGVPVDVVEAGGIVAL